MYLGSLGWIAVSREISSRRVSWVRVNSSIAMSFFAITKSWLSRPVQRSLVLRIMGRTFSER